MEFNKASRFQLFSRVSSGPPSDCSESKIVEKGNWPWAGSNEGMLMLFCFCSRLNALSFTHSKLFFFVQLDQD